MCVAVYVVRSAQKHAAAAQQPLSPFMSKSESASLDDVDLKPIRCLLFRVGQVCARRMVKPSQRHLPAGVNGGRRGVFRPSTPQLKWRKKAQASRDAISVGYKDDRPNLAWLYDARKRRALRGCITSGDPTGHYESAWI